MSHAIATHPNGNGDHQHPDLATFSLKWGHWNYWMIFIVLIALTVLTVAIAAGYEFKNELVNVCIALLIAFTKATFVARYFMHLKFEGKLIWTIFVIPLGLCVLLTVALIPDVGRGRHTAMNDTVGAFMGITSSEGISGHSNSAEPAHK